MLTRVICQTMPGARPLQTRTSASNILHPTNVSLLTLGHRQQTRAFRFGMWPSLFNPEPEKEPRHRHRVPKREDVDALNRRLSWDRLTVEEHPRVILKRMLRRYYISRFINSDEFNGQHRRTGPAPDARDERMKMKMKMSWGDNPFGFWVGSRSLWWKAQPEEPTDHWAEKSSDRTSQVDPEKSPKTSSVPNKKSEWRDHGYEANISFAEDYVIDPITNRKVIAQSKTTGSPSDSPLNDPLGDSNRSYGSHLTASKLPKDDRNLPPVYSNGPPPPAELEKYGQVDLYPASLDGVNDHGMPPSGSTGSPQQPILQSEEYALNHLPPEESVERYDDLHKYKPDKYDEFHQQVPGPEDKKYADLDKYDTYGAREAANAGTEMPQNGDELPKYKPYMYNENLHAENQRTQYEDLDQYGPYKYQEDVKKKDDSCPEYDDLDKYEHYDDNGKPADDSVQKYQDLDNYSPDSFQDSIKEELPSQQYEDLDKYGAFEDQELDDKPTLERDIVAESLREFDIKEHESNEDGDPRPSITDRRQNLNRNETHISHTSTPHLSPFSCRTPSVPDTTEFREKLEHSFAEISEASDEVDRIAKAHVKSFRINSQDENQANQSTLAGSHIKGDKGQTKPKLEPALDRQGTRSKSTCNNLSNTQAEIDPYSKEPQGLETSYAKENDGEHTPLTFTKMYSGKPSEEASNSQLAKEDNSPTTPPFKLLYHRDPEVDGPPAVSPFPSDTKAEQSQTLYKILAYNRTLEKVDTVETTSVVPDHASPLTPAEVLLRLSNPTKFFPYFASLQAEGFEIVSGGGDVLVFRQIRTGKAGNQESARPINPIDMMGKPTALPNAAAFVSPTGFVNYDMPRVEEEVQAPPFRSNIDVRREEPVFSGPKSTSREGKKGGKEKSVGKRVLVGGVWVAGISYALGVVSEYFITGGADGQGPKGF
ncbi:uncharacterized protein GGS25DRAFT_496040 [Hypoxylon fragiforme]|uniref:uncharacterized protein n=1 Tax=Hypoxylon fragiforme TaxID=63214 RepID=UPI0020C6C687|nr:uncharacterized protein GGS25DRAFT_496040 [Hypoxylon fragiforme]KAI2607481.1 hypothetical protein GGS25DRAFT_496040 [Hypoxylon fragiforme]